jgi:hypothetical protein
LGASVNEIEFHFFGNSLEALGSEFFGNPLRDQLLGPLYATPTACDNNLNEFHEIVVPTFG